MTPPDTRSLGKYAHQRSGGSRERSSRKDSASSSVDHPERLHTYPGYFPAETEVTTHVTYQSLQLIQERLRRRLSISPIVGYDR